MKRAKIGWSIAALVGLTLIVGCELHPTQEGERGNLEFSYHPADDAVEFDRPLAVGAELRMYVEPLDDRSFDTITDVETSPDEVLRAERLDDEDDAVLLIGKSGGTAELDIRVRGDDETYRDSLSVDVERVDQIGLEHRCTPAADAAYLEGWSASIDLNRRSASDERVVGAAQSRIEARDSCQVDIFPDHLQESPYCDSAGLHFPMLDEPGPVDLFVTEGVGIYGQYHGDVGVHVVDPDLMAFDPPSDQAVVDRTRTIQLEPVRDIPDESGYWSICTPMELEIEIYSRDTCRGPGGAAEFTIDADDANRIELEGKQPGLCQFDVHLVDRPELDPWSVDVEVRE